MSRYELRFSGAGGQGLITAGIIMAKAASIYQGKQAVQSQSYGPEARGGASKSEVIISDEPIDYPKVTKCDALLAMTQEACNKYSDDLKEIAVPVKAAEKMTPEQLKGKVLTGVLYKEDKPEYTEEYAKVIQRAQAAK